MTIKRKMKNGLLLGVLFLVLTACTDEKQEQVTPDGEKEEISTTGTHPFAGAGFDVKALHITVSDANSKPFEVVYAESESGLETSYSNQWENEELEEMKALSKLEPVLRKLNVDPTTTEAELERQLVTLFEIEESYEKIDVQIRFPNGEERSYDL